MHAALWVDVRLARVREDDAARADRREGPPFKDNARADRRCRIVASAADDDSIYRQSRFSENSLLMVPVTSGDS